MEFKPVNVGNGSKMWYNNGISLGESDSRRPKGVYFALSARLAHEIRLGISARNPHKNHQNILT